MDTNMEKDVRAAWDPQPTRRETSSSARERVAAYRKALAHAALSGTLDDKRGMAIAEQCELGLASASPSAAALISFERALYSARQTALSWTNSKSDRSTQVLALESLAEDAAERLAVDLTCFAL